MDIMMPEMDGYDTIRAIRARESWKSLPIVAVTAKAMKVIARNVELARPITSRNLSIRSSSSVGSSSGYIANGNGLSRINLATGGEMMGIARTEQGRNPLVVDDRRDRLIAVEAMLEELNERVVLAQSGREALQLLLQEDFAVILLDVAMPIMDGFETTKLIRQRKRSQQTPIIFLTAFGDSIQVAQGYAIGAVDYILTPVHPDILRAKVSAFVALHRKTEERSLRRNRSRIEQRSFRRSPDRRS